LKRAGVSYFRTCDLRSTYATRLSAGGVAYEWVTQLLRQGDAKVFKKYSQMKLRMKRGALEKVKRQANEMPLDSGRATIQQKNLAQSVTVVAKTMDRSSSKAGNCLRINSALHVGA
jgi:hypothetical protein